MLKIMLVMAVMLMSVGSSAAWAESKANPAEINAAQKLMRLDFQLAGTSCVACIRRVANKFQAAPGVIKADVSIYKPHWSVVVFDANKTNQDAVLQAVKTESVYMEALEATPLSSMPAVVVPRAAESAQTAGKP